MTIGGLNVSREVLLDFCKVERLSEFYYGTELGADLTDYFMQVDGLLRIRDRMHEAEKRNNPNFHEIQNEFLLLEEKCQDLGRNLDSSLRENCDLCDQDGSHEADVISGLGCRLGCHVV